MSKETKLTPVQELLKFMNSNWSKEEIEKDSWLKSIYSELEWQIPKEKQFMPDIWDAGQKWGSTEAMFDHGMKTRLDLENTQDKADFLSQYENDK